MLSLLLFSCIHSRDFSLTRESNSPSDYWRVRLLSLESRLFLYCPHSTTLSFRLQFPSFSISFLWIPWVVHSLASVFSPTLLSGSSGIAVSSCSVLARADKDWAVKRARPSKKVWCSGLGLCLEMSPVFHFGQGLRCGLCFRHCRCHWIMAAWELSWFLTLFFLALSPRGKCC